MDESMWEKIKNLSIVEWVLIEAIFFAFFWIGNPYIASLLTVVLAPIFGSILVIALIADRLDNSRIGNKFYWVMFWFTIIPLVLYLIFKVVIK